MYENSERSDAKFQLYQEEGRLATQSRNSITNHKH